MSDTPTLAPDEERRLLARTQKGDRDAFAQLVDAHRERLLAAALALTQNYDDARDLSQETFIRAFKAIHRFQLGRPFYPWLYRILRNLALTHLQRHGPSRQVSLDQLIEENHLQFEAPHQDPRETIAREQMARHLRNELQHLKPQFREILLMKHFQDMTYDDIAQALRIPIGTVMSRLYHARRALAKRMDKHRP